MRVKDPALVVLTKDLSGSQRSPKPGADKNAALFSPGDVLLYTRVCERRFGGTDVKVYELSDGRGWAHETVSKTEKDEDKGRDASSKRGLEVHGPPPTCQNPS